MKLSPKRVRLTLGWILGAAAIITSRPTVDSIVIGVSLAVLGAVLRGWAAGTIHKNRVLTTTGPYAFTRNPLYLGTFFIGLGLAAATGRYWLVPAFMVTYLAVYGWQMRHEARSLEVRFGEPYRHYAANVPLFVPRFTRYESAHLSPAFELSRYVANGEYQAGIGIFFTFLALLAKMALV